MDEKNLKIIVDFLFLVNTFSVKSKRYYLLFTLTNKNMIVKSIYFYSFLI